ncbi:MAG: DUF488 domain-containing protein, partial [Oscillospiraceae bacterium]|nr:DUF488 domain-containing protein [Oscillospiraceae bacterium]
NGFAARFAPYHAIALLCSEPTPDKCHRRLAAEMICAANSDIEIIHKSAREKWKVSFSHNGDSYDISMTDPMHYKLEIFENASIVVSLPSDDGGYSVYYKFAAAIYPFL